MIDMLTGVWCQFGRVVTICSFIVLIVIAAGQHFQIRSMQSEVAEARALEEAVAHGLRSGRSPRLRFQFKGSRLVSVVVVPDTTIGVGGDMQRPSVGLFEGGDPTNAVRKEEGEG